jgi:uncharacterized membrane protein YphA (DoxX/SURF4 family)
MSSLFPRLWACFSLILVAVTYPLWIASAFPVVPLVGAETIIPPSIGWCSSIVLVSALLSIVVDPQRFQRCWWLVTGSLCVSFVIDQHRLQPWAYQLAIYGVLFGGLPWQQTRRLLILLMASVYIYSAVGKFDYQFIHSVGQEFLQAIAKPVGGVPEQIGPATSAQLALLFPALELIAGLGILLPRTRRAAGLMLIAMHLSLMAILGPWSLDHSTGVLMWNLALLVQAYLILLQKESATYRKKNVSLERLTYDADSIQSSPIPMSVRVLLAGVVFMPIFERAGYWDHWTSWALYAPHTSRADLEIHESAIEGLPETMRPFLSHRDGGWCRLAVSRWSLAERKVPIYPQGRYQLALAVQLAKRHQLESEIRVRLRGVSDRWSGQRETTLMLGRKEIQAGLARYWLR